MKKRENLIQNKSYGSWGTVPRKYNSCFIQDLQTSYDFQIDDSEIGEQVAQYVGRGMCKRLTYLEDHFKKFITDWDQ